MDKFSTVIVDDEKKARLGLRSLLELDLEIEIIRECKDGLEALEFFQENSCDLLLLDIQMPAIDGFDVLKSIKNPPLTIFITAYDEFALKAFEHHAIDYLLKPFTNDRFFEAVGRVKEMLQSKKQNGLELEKLVNYLRKGQKESSLLHSSSADKRRLVIKDSGKVVLVNTSEVEFIASDDYYIKIHLAGTTYMIRESLKSIINRLPEDRFVRIHNSTIINMDFVQHFEHLQNAEYMVKLKSGNQVKVSRSYRTEFDRLVGDL